MSPAPELRNAAIRLNYHVAAHDRLMESMADDAAGQPSAQDPEQDRTSGHETRLFCWVHEQDPHQCHADGERCTGDVIPAATDITGESATTKDRVRSDLLEVRRLERTMLDTASRLALIHARYLPTNALPLEVKRKIVSASIPGCESCARLTLGDDEPWWNEANYNSGRPTNFGGALTKRMILCRPCAEWALDHDHDTLCLDDDGNPRKGHPHYQHAIHLPPVRGQLPQTLAKKREHGRWAGKKEPKADKAA